MELGHNLKVPKLFPKHLLGPLGMEKFRGKFINQWLKFFLG